MGKMWSEEGRILSGEEKVPAKKRKKPVKPEGVLSKQLDTNLSKQYDNDGNANHDEPEGYAMGRSH